jgi:hypothetical protein
MSNSGAKRLTRRHMPEDSGLHILRREDVARPVSACLPVSSRKMIEMIFIILGTECPH